MMGFSSPLRSSLGSRRGHAMLEFAIGSTVLVSLFTGAFQYGYIFYQYNTLYNAVANAAHYGGMYPYLNPNATPDGTFSAAVKNMVVYGQSTAGSTPVLTGLGTGNVNITIGYTGLENTTFRPTTVTVDISGYTINAVFGTFTCTNKPSVSFPYQGFYDP